ncbi:hypothetical protein [Planococcus sp. Urea-3u-39]|uniref:hypothetical protein n=1 Tax=Planococcus sp. Urea-3u-39 TaxID=2058328 RepID=UPI0027E524DB|nr:MULTISPECIES: hypothetical protein [unclassified Planococcus (in: firmicutes)]
MPKQSPGQFLINDRLERFVGRRDQAARKDDTLLFLSAQYTGIGFPLNHRCEFPSEIDGIPDAGVHALSTGRAVQLAGVV